ncbi:MAG TPA: diguanylate cyclase [Steroidobacteraceae bacterium]|nr:diguanylate cyclase [Steroidobacteraceae bacterium]
MNIPVPIDEMSRLEALNRYDVLNAEADPLFDNVVRLAASVCHTPIAKLGFLDRNQLWIKAAVGLDLRRIPRRASYSAYAICKQRQILVIPDARTDMRFAKNPLLAYEPPVRFLAAVPLIEPTGYAIGTLTVMDYQPRELSQSECDQLHALAETAVALLESRQMVRRLEGEVAERASYERRAAAEHRHLLLTNAALSSESMADPLTGMGNRRAFEHSLVQEVERACRLAYPLALLKIDIDHFKSFNETYGQAFGDQLLCRVAQVIGKVLRSTDFAARCGADEFAVILPGTDLRGARNLAERCRIAVEQDVMPRGVAHISIGVAQLAADDRTGEQLVAEAEQSFLRARQVGRSTELDIERRGPPLRMMV